MHIIRIAIALALLAATGAVALPAAAEIEVTPTVAYRSDDFSEQDPRIFCVQAPCDFPVESDDGAAFGVVVGFGFADGWAVELLANRWSADLESSLDEPPFDFEVTHLQAGLAYTWGRGNVRPFVGAAAGQSRVENDAPFGRETEDDAFSWSAGGGVKIGLTDLLALRLEARGYWVDLDDELGGSFMQQEVSAGLTFRF